MSVAWWKPRTRAVRVLISMSPEVLGLVPLWVLEALPRRVPGQPWIEAALAAACLVAHAAARRRDGKPPPTPAGSPHGFLCLAAAATGFGWSFLASALDAAGRLPASLADPRGGPVLLYAAAAALPWIRAQERRGPEHPPVAGVRSSRIRSMDAALFAIALLAFAGSLPLAAGGAFRVAASAMAVLAACSFTWIRNLSVEPPPRMVIVEKSDLVADEDLQVLGIFPFQPGLSAADLLHLAAAAEYGVSHPIRDAVLRSYDACSRTVPTIREVRHAPGLGVRARVQGQDVIFGKLRFLRECGVSAASLAIAEGRRERIVAEGGYPLYLAVDGEVAGAISLFEVLRPQAAKVLREMARSGIRTAVISGADPTWVEEVVRPLEAVEVHAGLLPHEKARRIDELTAKGAALPLGAGHDFESNMAEAARRVQALQSSFATVQAIRMAALVYHAVALPLFSGALAPWTGLPPSPACGALAGLLVSFVFPGVKNYNRPRSTHAH